ncbi:hypothetical protein [Nonomuraea basaltis]|uniref:hypothetical protein n=1 Tax=Nonomuraea basaltis TaxID=2495887 RepID=UPI00110C427B|nr:hypothetical protein [Nonomuraea basaltis]TMS00024.1 hypothetical protein EJK15_04490 [Nonomuraea basaltis]
MVLLQVRLPPGATLAAAMEALGLSEYEVDIAYGLVAVGPEPGLYVLRVIEEAGRRIGGDLFADPRIEPC